MGGALDSAVQYDKNADGSVNKDSITLGGSGGTTISNVADGVNASDAVNKGQLDETLNAANSYTDQQIANVTGGITQDITGIQNDITNIQSGADGMFQVDQSSPVTKPAPTGQNALAGGSGAVASGQNSMALGNAAQATGNNSSAVGTGSTASANNSVALGHGSVADRDNTVSVGSAGDERQVTNVAAGTADTDAVNVAQMNQAVAHVNSNLNYINGRVDNLERKIERYQDDAQAAAASAIAMASLPQPYAPGQSMMTMGVGAYESQAGIAVGVSHITDNGRWVIKGAGTTNSRGNVGVGVGVGFAW